MVCGVICVSAEEGASFLAERFGFCGARVDASFSPNASLSLQAHQTTGAYWHIGRRKEIHHMKSVIRAVLLGGLAMLALSGVAAASASAYTNPILENAKGEHVSKVKFTGRGPAGAVPIYDRYTGEYECGSGETSTGELSTTGTGSAATTSGTATFLFKGCRELRTGKRAANLK
jgi:hypothetical protein